MTTIREDRLEAAIVEKLGTLTLNDDDANKLEAAWLRWIASDKQPMLLHSVKRQIEETETRLDRLTDLLIDGTIDRDAYDRRKAGLMQELNQLYEEIENSSKKDLSPEEMQKFLELMKTLNLLYISANPAEKRRMVENAFSNRTVCPENVYLEPYNWLLEIKNIFSVSDGDPDRNTSRTEVKDMFGEFVHLICKTIMPTLSLFVILIFS